MSIMSAAQAEPALPSPPPAMIARLSEAYSAVEDLGYCSQQLTFRSGVIDYAMPSAWETLHEFGDTQVRAATRRAEGLMGKIELDWNADYDPHKPPKCSEDSVVQLSRRVQQKLTEAEGLLQPFEDASSHGLAFGMFPLCAETVGQTHTEAPDDVDADATAVVVVSIAPNYRSLFGAYSARFVGATVAVRLDGASIATAQVRSPLTSGFRVPAKTQQEAEAVTSAASRACPT